MKNLVKIACRSEDMFVDRQTDTHTDVFTTILRHHCCGWSNKSKHASV